MIAALRAGSAIAFLALFAAGCGGTDDRVKVQGKLLDNGKAFSLDASKMKLPAGATALPPGTKAIQIIFVPAEGGDTASASVSETDWTFSVPGSDGKGIKPGKYKIAITGGAGGGFPDYFGGKYSLDRTPIVRDVKAGEPIEIDVAKPAG